MRLDDDSSLLSCIDYDLFQFMRDNDLAYGYRQLAFDFPRVAQPIWNMSFEYLESKSIPKTEMFMNHQKNHRWDCLAPYNNFLISKLSFWTSPEVQSWLYHVDSSGIQYTGRISDLPVQTITLEMFMPAKQVHQFTDFAYSHFTLFSSGRCMWGALSWSAKTWADSNKRYLPRKATYLGEHNGDIMYGCGGMALSNWP